MILGRAISAGASFEEQDEQKQRKAGDDDKQPHRRRITDNLVFDFGCRSSIIRASRESDK
jgi:hypothetical protein